MRYQIWQIDYSWHDKHPDTPYHPWWTMGWEWAVSHGFSADDYVMMYEGEIEGDSPDDVLEDIFIIHNGSNRPAGDRMYSLSMSDVVAFPEYRAAFYVDRIGYKDVTPYFENKIARKRTAKMRKGAARVKYASDGEVCMCNICPMCGEEEMLCITEDEYERYERWANGEGLIQDMLPTLDPAEREFLMSGYCFDCQKLLFGSRKARLR